MQLDNVLQLPNAKLDKFGPLKNTEAGLQTPLTFETSMVTQEVIKILGLEFVFAKNTTARDGFSEVAANAEISHVHLDIPHPFDAGMPGIKVAPEKLDKFILFRNEGGTCGLKFRAMVMDHVDAIHSLVDFKAKFGEQEFILKLTPMQEPLKEQPEEEGDPFDAKPPAPPQQMLIGDGSVIDVAAETAEDVGLVVAETEWEDDGFYVHEKNDVKAIIRVRKGINSYTYQFRIIDGETKSTNEATDERQYDTHAEALGMAAKHLDNHLTTAWRRNNPNLSTQQKAGARSICAWATNIAADPAGAIEAKNREVAE